MKDNWPTISSGTKLAPYSPKKMFLILLAFESLSSVNPGQGQPTDWRKDHMLFK